MKTRFSWYSGMLIVGLLACIPSYAQWAKTNGPDSVRVLGTADGVAVYAGTRSGVFLSMDSGTTWIAVNNGLTHANVRSLILRPGMVFVGTEGGGAFRSTNNGASWIPVNNGLTGLDVRAFAFSENYLFAGTESGVFRSIDSGASWIPVNIGLSSLNVQSLLVVPSRLPAGLYAGTADSGIFRSTNNGSDWSKHNGGLTSLDIRAFGSADGGADLMFCVGTGSGVFHHGSGSNPAWYGVTGLPNLAINSLAGAKAVLHGPGAALIAGTEGGGVFVSKENPSFWSAVNTGLMDLNVRAVAMEEDNSFGYMFAGANGGIWRRITYEVTSIAERSPSAPLRFRLDGHRSISVTLPSRSRVTLEVFSPTGERVAVLLSEELPSGAHTVRLNATALPNGLYFYRLRAGAVTETRKVLLSR